VPISTLDGIIGGTKSQSMIFKSAGQPTHAAGSWHTFWTATAIPAAGTAAATSSTAGQLFDKFTAGAGIYTDPAGGQFQYIISGQVTSTISGLVMLYDRLWGCGNATPVNGTYTNPAQATDVYRPVTGEGVELWAEITTVFSAVAHTLTATYVNEGGTGSRTATCTIPASAPVGRMFPFTLQAGDKGVRRVTALAGSSAPTGAFNILAIRPLLRIGAVANLPVQLTPLVSGMKPIEANACLALAFYNPAGTTAPALTVSLDFAAG
jgi:hypothetical protein